MGGGDVCGGRRLSLQNYKSWLHVSGSLGRFFFGFWLYLEVVVVLRLLLRPVDSQHRNCFTWQLRKKSKLVAFW